MILLSVSRCNKLSPPMGLINSQGITNYLPLSLNNLLSENHAVLIFILFASCRKQVNTKNLYWELTFALVEV
jgi:hypothetical protein